MVKINRKLLSLLSLVALLGLFGTGFASRIPSVRAAQDAACASPDTDQIQEQNGADDTTEPQCPEDGQQGDDAEACIIFGGDTQDNGSQVEATDTPDQNGQVDNSNEANDDNDQVGSGQDIETADDAGNQQDQTAIDDNQDAASGEAIDPAFTGSIKLDGAAFQQSPATVRCDALKAKSKITADEAKTAAMSGNSGSEVVKIELDIENGYLVYDVQLKDGRDVKVDAGNGSILATQASDPND